MTPYLPSAHPSSTLPDPSTPYLLVLSLFLWSPEQWTKHSRSVLLHLLRFVFSQTPPSIVASTKDTAQVASTLHQAGSSADQTAASSNETVTSTVEPGASPSQTGPTSSQSTMRHTQTSSDAASSSSPQAGQGLVQWQQQSDEELWRVAAPMLRFFGLVHHLQSRLKGSEDADWLAATKTRCGMTCVASSIKDEGATVQLLLANDMFKHFLRCACGGCWYQICPYVC